MQSTKANALYAGADLHGNNVFLSLCDQEGNTVFRKRVKANLAAVNTALDPFWKRIAALGVCVSVLPLIVAWPIATKYF